MTELLQISLLMQNHGSLKFGKSPAKYLFLSTHVLLPLSTHVAAVTTFKIRNG